MSATIANGADRSIALPGGTVPDVSGALRDWFQPLVFALVTKTTIGFQVVETATFVNFQGIVQPFTPRQLSQRPAGERAWTWLTVHADPVLTLQVDDVGQFNGKQTRVMSRKNYALYGFVEYTWVQDYTGVGP